MITDALIVLSCIDQGLPIDKRSAQRWLPALRTIQWLKDADDGLYLTADGRAALASGGYAVRAAAMASAARA